MSTSKKYEPSDAELEILQVLWAYQPATVKTVHEEISKKRAAENRDEVGYTTILKQMQRMFKSDKKAIMLSREIQGKQHYYTAIPEKEDIQSTLTDKLVDKAFSGSAMQMVMHALGQGKTTPAELEALQKWLDQQTEE